jgi:hypothetical protein
LVWNPANAKLTRNVAIRGVRRLGAVKRAREHAERIDLAPHGWRERRWTGNDSGRKSATNAAFSATSPAAASAGARMSRPLNTPPSAGPNMKPSPKVAPNRPKVRVRA